MPPKVVYGKKKTAKRTETSFTKLITPEKDGVTTGRKEGKAEDDWRQQLESAAKGMKEVDAIEGLEKVLEGLSLEQRQGKKEKKSRSRKVVEDHGLGEAKENQGPGEHTVKSRTQDVASSKQVERQPKKRATRTPQADRRRPFECEDAKDKADLEVKAREPGSIRGQAHRPVGDSRSTPTKVRQPAPRARPRHVHSPIPRSPTAPMSTSQTTDVYSTYASPLLAMSDTKTMQTFDEWSKELESHIEITKIAEASFSEVYRLSTRNPSGGSTQESVLKLVALKTPHDAPLPCQLNPRMARDRKGQVEKERADREEKDKWKSDVDDVLSEVKLLQNLNHIPGFTDFRELTILQGRPTSFFAKAWKEWNKARARGKKSEFPDPGKKGSYDDTQLWAVIEMQDAGTDCEKLMEAGGLNSIWEVWDVFWGVCLSIAKAEETCKFEHRDLHLGNICVRSSSPDGDVTHPIVEGPVHRKFRFTGLETTVIDYTLSRADILTSSSRRSSSSSAGTLASSSSITDTAPDVAFLDLDKDPAVFEGDASEEYQYEIYRYMRGVVLYNNPLQNSAPQPEGVRRSPRKNTHIRFHSTCSDSGDIVWRKFHPKTNLVWSHFLLHKLLAHVDVSATATITSDEADLIKVKKKALKLRAVLKKVADLLCPVQLGSGDSLSSVKDLVLLALDQRWLRMQDVVG